ncbi:MAG: hypothetical protein MHM6MM_004290 [Cercozoa sp. M6MM]
MCMLFTIMRLLALLGLLVETTASICDYDSLVLTDRNAEEVAKCRDIPSTALIVEVPGYSGDLSELQVGMLVSLSVTITGTLSDLPSPRNFTLTHLRLATKLSFLGDVYDERGSPVEFPLPKSRPVVERISFPALITIEEGDPDNISFLARGIGIRNLNVGRFEAPKLQTPLKAPALPGLPISYNTAASVLDNTNFIATFRAHVSIHYNAASSDNVDSFAVCRRFEHILSSALSLKWEDWRREQDLQQIGDEAVQQELSCWRRALSLEGTLRARHIDVSFRHPRVQQLLTHLTHIQYVERMLNETVNTGLILRDRDLSGSIDSYYFPELRQINYRTALITSGLRNALIAPKLEVVSESSRFPSVYSFALTNLTRVDEFVFPFASMPHAHPRSCLGIWQSFGYLQQRDARVALDRMLKNCDASPENEPSLQHDRLLDVPRVDGAPPHARAALRGYFAPTRVDSDTCASREDCVVDLRIMFDRLLDNESATAAWVGTHHTCTSNVKIDDVNGLRCRVKDSMLMLSLPYREFTRVLDMNVPVTLVWDDVRWRQRHGGQYYTMQHTAYAFLPSYLPPVLSIDSEDPRVTWIEAVFPVVECSLPFWQSESDESTLCQWMLAEWLQDHPIFLNAPAKSMRCTVRKGTRQIVYRLENDDVGLADLFIDIYGEDQRDWRFSLSRAFWRPGLFLGEVAQTDMYCLPPVALDLSGDKLMHGQCQRDNVDEEPFPLWVILTMSGIAAVVTVLCVLWLCRSRQQRAHAEDAVSPLLSQRTHLMHEDDDSVTERTPRFTDRNSEEDLRLVVGEDSDSPR